MKSCHVNYVDLFQVIVLSFHFLRSVFLLLANHLEILFHVTVKILLCIQYAFLFLVLLISYTIRIKYTSSVPDTFFFLARSKIRDTFSILGL